MLLVVQLGVIVPVWGGALLILVTFLLVPVHSTVLWAPLDITGVMYWRYWRDYIR